MAENPADRPTIVRPTRDDMEKVTRHVGVPESELPPVIQETNWDKPAPDGPPAAAKDTTPAHLIPLVHLFDEVIFLDSLLMDRCVKKAMLIIKKNVFSSAYGMDNIPMEGNPTHPVNIAGIAAPISIELYKQALLTIRETAETRAMYEKAILESKEILNGSKTPKIITP